MEPTNQGGSSSGMFGGTPQDNTVFDETTTIQATGMFATEQSPETTKLTITTLSEQPVSESVVVQPVSESVVVQPVSESVVVQPVSESVVVQPVSESVVVQPVSESVVVQPVSESVVVQPVSESVVVQPVSESVVVQPVSESVVVQPVSEQPVTPLSIMSLDQSMQSTQTQTPPSGSMMKGLETLKEAPEFKGIDIDSIIAHTNPTGTGATIASSTAPTQIPTSSAFKKMAAIGSGFFVLAGVGVYVFSTMYSAGSTTSANLDLQANVLAAQPTEPTTKINNEQSDTSGSTTSTNSIEDTGTTTENMTDTTTSVDTTTQPSYGPVESGGTTPDLIEQVGEPSNALVDTVGHINTIDTKISFLEKLIKEAATDKKDDAVKYGTFAITKYKEIKQKLENGGFSSNKDVEDILAKIDQFYNKSVDIMNT